VTNKNIVTYLSSFNLKAKWSEDLLLIRYIITIYTKFMSLSVNLSDNKESIMILVNSVGHNY
jgi:hypothetical protein